MPLVRFPVRNEYGLGHPELYTSAEKREDPKALLEGVAVAGLVGILRQLGDLAEFAAEVFHGLQEQVTSTSSRSRKMLARVQRIEAALPPLEKAMLAQKSHLHFAYTNGSVYRAHLQTEQNHFIYGDLPEFIMDTYQECSDPPRLHLLDKFDSGGPGSCLNRYSDPSFFKKASALSGEAGVCKLSKSRKSHKSKKKRARQRVVSSRGPSVSNNSDRPQLASLQAGGQFSPSQTVSTFDGTVKSDHEDQESAIDLKTDSGYIECVFDLPRPVVREELEPEQLNYSSLQMPQDNIFGLASVEVFSRDIGANFGQSPLQEHIRPSSSSVSWDEKADDFGRGSLQEQIRPSSSSVSWDEKADDFGRGSLQEQIRPSSSSVSWDEKAEIVEPTVPHELVETAEVAGTELDRDLENGAVIDDDQMEFSFGNEGILASMTSQMWPDDLESEPDNFMDALNTIESESETDIDFQTKREVEQSINLNDEKAKEGIHGHIVHLSDDQSSNQTLQEVEKSCGIRQQVEQICSSNTDRRDGGINGFVIDNSDLQPQNSESCSAAPSAFSDKSSFDNPLSSQCCASEELPQSEESSNVVKSMDMDISVNSSILESANADTPSKFPQSGTEDLDQQGPSTCAVEKPSGEHQTNSLKESFAAQSIQFWTNGGLLGLEPSKPPDFSATSAVSQGTEASCKDTANCFLSQSNNVTNDGDVRKPDDLVQSSKIIKRNSSKCSASYPDDPNPLSDKKTSWSFLSTVLDAKREKNGYFQITNSFNNNFAQSFGRINGVIPKNEQKMSANGRALLTETSQKEFSNAAQTSVVSNGVPVNYLQRSLVHDQKSVNESRGQICRELSERTFKSYNGNGSPIHSPSSSPPLQHMKISFQPVNVTGTPKLKLKFPDGNFGHESSIDMLPSFQLVPEPATPGHDIASDSDDDTFCRSSPYMSDDRLSDESESNSEQWNSDDNSEKKDTEMYDVLRGISVNESVPTSTETEETRHKSIDVNYGFQNPYADKCSEPCQSSSDLPNLSAMNPLFEQEMKSLSDANYFSKSHFPEENTPLPPPLPPSEWRNMKPHSNVTTTKQESICEAPACANQLKSLDSTISPQSKTNSVKQQLDTDDAVAPETRGVKPDGRISNEQKEVKQSIKGRIIDEEGDFLHQIRTKSFNLRRTMTEKLHVTTGHATDPKVTAILVKANAIRQAVGSDDGEDDDTWSEV